MISIITEQRAESRAEQIVLNILVLSQSRSKGNMQAYCQLARQGLGLMIFLLSGGEREEGEGGEIESHAKMCCVVLLHLAG